METHSLRSLICWAVLVATVAMGAIAEARTWTVPKGDFSMDAEFVEVETQTDGDIVILKKEDGKTTRVRLDRLSERDQAYVVAEGRKKVANKPSQQAVRLAADAKSEDVDGILEGLCGQGKFQTAREFLTIIGTSPGIDDETKATISCRQATLELRAAAAVPEPQRSLKRALTLRAILRWVGFAQDRPEHTRAYSSVLQAVGAYRGLAQVCLLEAANLVGEKNRKREEVRQDAREYLRGASTTLAGFRERLKMQQRELDEKASRGGEPVDANRTEMIGQLITLDFRRAELAWRLTETYDDGSDLQKQQLVHAAEDYEDFVARYPRHVIALKAVVLVGKCYRELGNAQRTRETVVGMLTDEVVSKNDDILDLRHEALAMAFVLWGEQIQRTKDDHRALSIFEQAFRISDPLVKGKELRQPEYLAIVYQRARLAATMAKKNQRLRSQGLQKRYDAATKAAIDLATFVAEYEGEYQNAAAELRDSMKAHRESMSPPDTPNARLVSLIQNANSYRRAKPIFERACKANDVDLAKAVGSPEKVLLVRTVRALLIWAIVDRMEHVPGEDVRVAREALLKEVADIETELDELRESTQPQKADPETKKPLEVVEPADAKMGWGNLALSDDAVETLVGRGTWISSNNDEVSGWNPRKGILRGLAVFRGGGTPKSEAAVGAWLNWLARHQNRKGQNAGSWSFNLTRGDRCQFENPGQNASKIGATSLGLLAFLGQGHTHIAPGPYRDTVLAALKFLLSRMDRSGHFNEGMAQNKSLIASHGIAACALAEAYGMTGDKQLLRSAQLALNYTVTSQHREGGWGNLSGQAGHTSVVGWQMIALKSAERAGLEIPEKVFSGVMGYLESVQQEGGFKYNHQPEKPGGNLPATSAIGLLCRTYLGGPRDHAAFQGGVAYLGDMGLQPFNVKFNYYATMFLFQNDGPRGDAWQKWNAAMREHLLKSQDKGRELRKQGSWFFAKENSNGRPTAGGRLYHTALSIMTLEVYYRYENIYDAE